MILNHLIEFLIFATLIASVSFVSLYSLAPWRISSLGKATMLWACSMVVWCISGLVFSFIGPHVWFYPYLRVASYTTTGGAMWTMVILLWRTQREVRRQIEDEDKVPLP